MSAAPDLAVAPAAPAPGASAAPDLLDERALAFLAGLHRSFDARRRTLLAARRERQAAFDAGALPGFREDTLAIREGDWRVAALPDALLDRRVEITGPVDPKMVINALNSGASCYMADFEDSTAPTWDALLTGQRALRGAIAGTLAYDAENGKAYRLKPEGERAVLIVRPRGWHLDEKHLLVDGERIAASLFDAGLFCLHNGAALAARDRGPYLYLPKLQSMEEAALWDDVLAQVAPTLGLPRGCLRV
ncbi:MAG: malate synthase A, partial [Gammaproteobacteria bacterium]|nr:malate synthase A [Gammaproteobacteria bacterium]